MSLFLIIPFLNMSCFSFREKRIESILDCLEPGKRTEIITTGEWILIYVYTLNIYLIIDNMV